ncbi:3'-5' exonuclease [Helicobacter himalayensis]|uniref:3'-5' exonuclease n=1 Tax=Helicobacter himalayensis TaxID=1591088 RepID=UPI003D6FA448
MSSKTAISANMLKGFNELLNKLCVMPLEKNVFESHLQNIGGFFSDLDTQREILRAFGFPIVESEDKVFLSTKNLRLSEANFCFVDIETTGAKAHEHEIIEIGALKYRNGEVIERFESFIYAPFVPQEITHLTGIGAKDLQNAPRADEVLARFRLFLQDCIFVAHNVNFDYEFLNVSFQKHNLPGLLCPKLCTIELARKSILSPRYALSFLNTFLGINTPASHRAYADALTCLEVYKIASLCLPDSVKNVQDLIDFSKGRKQIL